MFSVLSAFLLLCGHPKQLFKLQNAHCRSNRDHTREMTGVGMAEASVICSETVSRVSSVLNREAKRFGKKNMFDGSEETCWNSDQGANQWLTLEFPQLVSVSQIWIQFQGGFSSRKCTIQGFRKGDDLAQVAEFYPEDINCIQRFSFKDVQLDKMKITFEETTDFFGRVVVYQVDVLGEKL